MATYNLNRIQDPNGNVYIVNGTPNQYGTCSTGASTAEKTVTVANSGFVLEAGVRVSVKFSSANTASNPTLNVNSKSAKNIYHKGSRITTGENKALLAGIVDFIYDGTQWHLVGNYIDTTGSDGDTKVTQAYSTTNNNYPLLMTVTAGTSSTSSRGATTSILNNQIYANPNSGTIYSKIFAASGHFSILSDTQDMSSESPWFGQNDVDTLIFSKGIEWIDQDEDGDPHPLYFPNVGGTIVASSNNSTKDIQVVTSLPASPDVNTLYFIK